MYLFGQYICGKAIFYDFRKYMKAVIIFNILIIQVLNHFGQTNFIYFVIWSKKKKNKTDYRHTVSCAFL